MTTAALDMVPAIAVIPGRADSLRRMRLALPSPGPHEALVQTIRVGVCGTDREIMRGEFGQAPAGSEALVIGHEVLGRVAAV
ncbi:MAG TPA: alcohol dehydrogenase catalytic domain-containing protein, partial [Vicinamibacterales bacterium]|nr:alcohol dehydrogenase catalytic domain-containing protein [Vicinamibacterales bacterium]